MDIKVLFFAEKKNTYCDCAEKLLKTYFREDQIVSCRGTVGDMLDEEIRFYNPDHIISFASPWIIPKAILNSAKVSAINFHPGPPEYPGMGCYNFALYNQCKRYGVTMHYMEEAIYTGGIISTLYFDTAPFDTVETLELKAMNQLLYLFEKTISSIVCGETFPKSNEKWKRKAFTKKELDKLFEINLLKDSNEEVEKKIKASSHHLHCKAYMILGDKKFYLKNENKTLVT